jgi:hypothetical protein
VRAGGQCVWEERQRWETKTENNAPAAPAAPAAPVCVVVCVMEGQKKVVVRRADGVVAPFCFLFFCFQAPWARKKSTLPHKKTHQPPQPPHPGFLCVWEESTVCACVCG